jgi:hypothetical protein
MTNGLARITTPAPARDDRHALQPRDFGELIRFAETVAGTSFAPTSKAAEIVAMIANGRELGLTAMQSLKAFHSIQGKPSMSADAMVAVVRASGLCERWDVMVSWALVDGLRLDVTLNTRGHWAAKARKIAAQRAAVADAIGLCDRPALPCVVTITRRSLGRALDDDNAVSSAKATRDAVAEWLGVDDRDPRVTGVVAQERAPRDVFAVASEPHLREDGELHAEPRRAAFGAPVLSPHRDAALGSAKGEDRVQHGEATRARARLYQLLPLDGDRDAHERTAARWRRPSTRDQPLTGASSALRRAPVSVAPSRLA